MGFRLLLAVAFALVLAAFAAQNAEPVTVRFLGWQARVALVVVIVVTAAAGGLLVALLTALRQVQLALRLRGGQAQVRRMEAELLALREERSRLQARVAELEAEVRSRREAAPGGEAAGRPAAPAG